MTVVGLATRSTQPKGDRGIWLRVSASIRCRWYAPLDAVLSRCSRMRPFACPPHLQGKLTISKWQRGCVGVQPHRENSLCPRLIVEGQRTEKSPLSRLVGRPGCYIDAAAACLAILMQGSSGPGESEMRPGGP